MIEQAVGILGANATIASGLDDDCTRLDRESVKFLRHLPT